MPASPLRFLAVVAEVGVSESSSSARREGKTKVVVFLHITTCGLIYDDSILLQPTHLFIICPGAFVDVHLGGDLGLFHTLRSYSNRRD